MKTFALSSGSCGNSFFFESKRGERILVDLGLSFKKIEEYLNEKKVDVNSIKAVFITHEHRDHSYAINTMLKKTNVRIFLSRGTFENLDVEIDEEFLDRVEFIDGYSVTQLEEFKVFSMEKFHDAVEPLSFIIEENGYKAAVFTDIGEITPDIKYNLKDIEIIYIEANYCQEMANENKNGLSINYLGRVCSGKGHLSVQECGEILSQIVSDEQIVVLSHISSNINTYQRAYSVVKKALEKVEVNPKILMSFQNEPTKLIELDK